MSQLQCHPIAANQSGDYVYQESINQPDSRPNKKCNPTLEKCFSDILISPNHDKKKDEYLAVVTFSQYLASVKQIYLQTKDNKILKASLSSYMTPYTAWGPHRATIKIPKSKIRFLRGSAKIFIGVKTAPFGTNYFTNHKVCLELYWNPKWEK
ncbi:hypothetical protein BVY03_04560 [bacterium K02(2017)]|nr:hypothetical protein BVY03_04560 [bacterium K02(2017)]